MAIPDLKAAKGSTTWRVFRFFVVVWGIQALWTWAATGTFLTPDVWAAWWIDLFADAVRWIDGLWTNRVAS